MSKMICVSDDFHLRLKKYAVSQQRTMGDIVHHVLGNYMEEKNA